MCFFMLSIEALRAEERNEMTALLQTIFAFHERKKDHCPSSLPFGNSLLVRTDNGVYLIYGRTETGKLAIHFSSVSMQPFTEHLHLWWPRLRDYAREFGMLPGLRGEHQYVRPQAQSVNSTGLPHCSAVAYKDRQPSISLPDDRHAA